MWVGKHSFTVVEGEEHCVVKNGQTSSENYSFVAFFEQENMYRHNKTFDTFKEAYAFMLKIFFSANHKGVVKVSKEHWRYTENEIAC